MPRIGVGEVYETLWNSAAPVGTTSLGQATWVGMYVVFNVSGRLAGLRAYVYPTGGKRHYGWASPDHQNQLIYFCTFTGYHKNPTTTGWTSAFFHPWLHIPAGQRWIYAVAFSFTTTGLMVAAHSGDTDTTIGDFTIPADVSGTPNGGYQQLDLTLALPQSLGAAKPAIDVLFVPD